VGQRVVEVTERLELAHQDQEMLAKLEEARLSLSLLVRGVPARRPATARAYAQAFQEYGIDPGAGDAANRLRRRAIHAELAAALDDWAEAEPDADRTRRLRELALATDPDPTRRKVREAAQKKAVAPLVALAAQPEALPTPTLRLLGSALWHLGANREAEGVLRKAHLDNPGDFWAALQLGECLYDTQPFESDEPLRLFAACVALRGDSAAAHGNLGVALGKKGDLEQALQHLSRAAKLQPALALARFNLGSALAEADRLDEAVVELREAHRLGPGDPETLAALGAALSRADKLDEAEMLLRRAVALRPTEAGARTDLGLNSWKRGKVDDALGQFAEAVRLAPRDKRAHAGLALALAANGRLSQALAQLRKADVPAPAKRTASTPRSRRSSPASVLVHFEQGESLARQGKLDEAIRQYRKAIALDPDSFYARARLGMALADQGQLAEAIAHLRQAISEPYQVREAYQRFREEGDPKPGEGPRFPQPLSFEALQRYELTLAAMLLKAGLQREAVETYRAVLERFYLLLVPLIDLEGGERLEEHLPQLRAAVDVLPKHGQAHLILGVALARTGDLRGALEHLHEAVALSPKDAPTHAALALVAQEAGNREEAIEHFRAAVDLQPDYRFAAAHLGVALLEKGETDQGLKMLRQAVATNSGDLVPFYVAAPVGAALLERGEVADGLTWLLAAAQNPFSGPAESFFLALVRQQRGQYSAALYGLARSHALASGEADNIPDTFDAPSSGTVGGLRWKTGRTAESAPPLLEAIALVARQAEAARLGLERRLPQVLAGKDRLTRAERWELIRICQDKDKQLYVSAARLCEAALRELPFPLDVRDRNRQNAARIALLAAAGEGPEGPGLSAEERSRWRQQALAWLRADLALWATRKPGPDEVTPPDPPFKAWFQDPDLASVRGEALAQLPQAEQAEWRKFWGEVDQLQRRLAPNN
jgi:tetratricopeptide (TPR) repeat protein